MLQFSWEIQQGCKTIRIVFFTLQKVAIIILKILDGMFLSLSSRYNIKMDFVRPSNIVQIFRVVEHWTMIYVIFKK